MLANLSNLKKAGLFYGIVMTVSPALVLFFRITAPAAQTKTGPAGPGNGLNITDTKVYCHFTYHQKFEKRRRT
jgi:hypothetical protein